MFPFAIDDGWTARAFLYHEPTDVRIRIYYRPTSVTERGELWDRTPETISNKDRAALHAIECAKRIVKWEFLDEDGNVLTELKDGQGRPHPIPDPTEEWLRKLTILLTDIATIVCFGGTSKTVDPFMPEQFVWSAEGTEEQRGN